MIIMTGCCKIVRSSNLPDRRRLCTTVVADDACDAKCLGVGRLFNGCSYRIKILASAGMHLPDLAQLWCSPSCKLQPSLFLGDDDINTFLCDLTTYSILIDSFQSVDALTLLRSTTTHRRIILFRSPLTIRDSFSNDTYVRSFSLR
jgi:hypothetical protein